jgi:hypothetical protein
MASVLAVLAFLSLCSSLRARAEVPAEANGRDSAEQRASILSSYAAMPLVFEANQGQADSAIQFLSRGLGHEILLSRNAAVLGAATPRPDRRESGPPQVSTLRMQFLGGRRDGLMKGEAPLPGTSNYFLRDGKRFTDIAHFAKVRHVNVYPGIDVLYYGKRQALEYDFIVAPTADPARIKLAFDGASKLRIDRDGDLILSMAGGEMRQHKPVIYQEENGIRQPVDGAYTRLARNVVGIRVARYDRSRPLIIDPVLHYGSYVPGGAASYAIAVDSAGNAYVTGQVWQTQSLAFPTVNAYQGSIAHGATIAFILKFNASGSALLYSTYLGGKTTAGAVAIAVDATGSAYITGTVAGSDFPVTANAYQKSVSTGGSFISKLGPAGNSLPYSTYLLNATATAIAVDAGGNAYITGAAKPAFATTSGILQTATHSPSSTNAFAVKLNPTGSAPVYATFLGGSGTDQGNGIALDGAGNAYIAGSTTSMDFPTVNAFHPTSAGGREAFVAKLNPAATALSYSTYLGGSQDDYATAIAIDGSGSAYIAGNTASFDFPVLNAFQPYKGGQGISGSIDNAFVAKLTPSGNDLVYSSFLGGNGCIGPDNPFCLIAHPIDIGLSIAVDNVGHAFVAGLTQSMAFPTMDSLEPAIASNGQGAFIAEISATGGALIFSSILSNNGFEDAARGVATDAAGNVYGTGSITGFPTTPGAYSASGYFATFKIASAAVAVTLASSLTSPATAGQPALLTARVTGAPPGGWVQFMDAATVLGSAAVNGASATLTTTLPAGIHGVTAIYRGGGYEAESPVLYQVVNPATLCN